MSRNLLIASGGCGGKLLDAGYDVLSESFGLKATYDGLFINSNENEMKSLKNFNSKNGLVINGGGTGRSRTKAKKDLSDDKTKLMNYFANMIENYMNAYIMTSSDGGFGSGSITTIANVIRMLSSEIKINVLATMPKLSSRRLSLQNAIDFYADIIQLRQNGVINSVIFIDNDKMTEEDEFNHNVMRDFINSLELGNSAIDVNDSKLVNSADKYKVILPLSNKFRSMDDAINDAIKSSSFIMPSNYNCTHLGGVFVNTEYNKDEVYNHFDIRDFDKVEYGNQNLIVLGGCAMPDDHINVLQDVLKDIENCNNEEQESKFVPRKTTVQQTKKEESSQNNVQKMRNMMSASFWD